VAQCLNQFVATKIFQQEAVTTAIPRYDFHRQSFQLLAQNIRICSSIISLHLKEVNEKSIETQLHRTNNATIET
jgi:hypothetical protein